jgi:phosphate-selective porin OprO/OprP
MHIGYWTLAAALAGAGGVQVVRGDARDEVISALQRKLEELDQKVKALERNRELGTETAEARGKETPRISAGSSGFSISSPDTNFVLRIRGYVQADSRWFLENSVQGADTFLLRRVRPIFEGTLFDKLDYKIMLDFGANTSSTGNNTSNNGMLQDAYLTARLLPEVQVQAGKFKEPVGFERLQSGANLLFVERGYPTQLVPNRDVGVQLQGNLFDGALTYAVGAFNGTPDGGSNDIEAGDDDKDVAARLFATPFKNGTFEPLRGLGFGVSGTFGDQEGALRGFVSPGQQRIFSYRTGVGTDSATANITADGTHWRIVPQAYYYWGPFGILGEYVISDQEVRRDAGDKSFHRVANTAWQVSASYFITGEDNSFLPVVPRRPFNFHGGGWGAWEVAARVGQLKIDDGAFPLLANPATSAREATSWGVGLNWHLNRNLKLSLNYEQTQFRGGSTPLLKQGEKAILTRAQITF